MNNFFDNLLKASTPATMLTPSADPAIASRSPQPSSLDGALAGQTLLNLLQQSQGLTPSSQPQATSQPSVTSDSVETDAARQLKAMMLNSSARLLGRNSESSSSAAQIRDMLEGSSIRDQSPTKKPFGIILRGTCNFFEWENDIPMGIPSGMSQICKLKNLASPEQVKRLISFSASEQRLVYAIQAQPRSTDQGGKMRVLNQAKGTRTLLTGHSEPVVDVLMCPWDSSLILSVSSAGVVILWRIIDEFSKTGSEPEDTASAAMSSKIMCSIKSGRDPFKTVAWHPSTPVIAIARGSSIEIWDLTDVIFPEESEEPAEDLVPPAFTNTPADPRVTVLQEHHEAVNTVCFSPDGSQLCSGADDGAVCIWNWNRRELVRKFTPDDDRPVNVVYWARSRQFSSPSSDRLLYIQCDAHRNVQMWDVQGDSPCARLDFPPGKNRISFQNMIVDNTASFIIVPFNDSSGSDCTDGSDDDLQNNSAPELDPLGCRFDFLLPFNVQQLVVSAVAIVSEGTPTSLQLYTVQKHAVQLFQFTDLQYSSLSPPNPVNNHPSSVAAPSLSITDNNPDRPVSQSREPPIPISNMSPMGDTSHHRPSFAVQGFVNRPASVQSSPSAVTPTAVLSRTQSGHGSSSRLSFTSDRNASGGKTSLPSSPVHRGSGISEDEIKQLLNQHIGSLCQEIAAERKARDKEEIRRTKQLLESVSKTINVIIPERVDQAVNQAVASVIERSVVPKLETLVSNLIQHHIKELPFMLRAPIMESFRESFKDQLLPAFRGSFSTMFQQINSTLETGLRQQSEQQLGHLITTQSFEAVCSLLKSIDLKLSQRDIGRSRQEPVLDLKKEIAALTEQDRFNEAFTKALNAGDASLVVWLCSQLRPSALHQRGPHECSPPVLLSLAQQISFNLTESESSIAMQLEWLRESLLALSTRPRSDQIAAHVPAVLSQIQNNIEHCMNELDSEQQSSVRIIMFLLTNLAK